MSYEFMKNPTDSQKDAVKCLDTNILVSASAGTGKTTVLVSRILKRILVDGVDIERLLVMTFTKAAASNMKEKLREQLEELSKDGSIYKDKALEALNKLGNSHIQTIDSFLLFVVKDNFYKLGLDAGFNLANDEDLVLLKNEIIDTVLDSKYNNLTDSFKSFIKYFSNSIDDENPLNTIISISDTLDGEVDVETFVQDIRDFYNILEKMEPISSSSIESLTKEAAKRKTERPKEDILNDLEASYRYEIDNLNIKNRLLKYLIDILKINNESRKLNDIIEEFKDCKERIIVINELLDIVMEYRKELIKKKLDRSIITFSDLGQFVVELFKDREVVDIYKSSFDEIMVDEYQDTSSIQEFILNSIANNNLFMVGDLKQSIYGFRKSRVDIFINKMNDYGNNKGGKLIVLKENFRSRKEILDFTNEIFSNIMDEKNANRIYDEKAMLVAGGKQDEIDYIPTCIDVINKKSSEITGVDLNELQYRDVLLRIRELVEKNGYSYKDICILARTKEPLAGVMELLQMNNIPCMFNVKGGYFESVEIKVLLSYLNIIDNLNLDIELAASLLSAIGGFNEEDLVRVSISSSEKSLYDKIIYYINNKDGEFYDIEIAKRLEEFLKRVNNYKLLATSLKISELLERIIRETGYSYYLSVESESGLAIYNLDKLRMIISSYEESNSYSLFSFLRYIDELKLNSVDLDSMNVSLDSENFVSLMTVHGSKGLDFKVVFLLDIGKKYNNRASRFRTHHVFGVSLLNIDLDKNIKYPSVFHDVVAADKEKENVGEELRLLYVALTRAKERLFINIHYGR